MPDTSPMMAQTTKESRIAWTLQPIGQPVASESRKERAKPKKIPTNPPSASPLARYAEIGAARRGEVLHECH